VSDLGSRRASRKWALQEKDAVRVEVCQKTNLREEVIWEEAFRKEGDDEGQRALREGISSNEDAKESVQK
jgi:hypothetical protein